MYITVNARAIGTANRILYTPAFSIGMERSVLLGVFTIFTSFKWIACIFPYKQTVDEKQSQQGQDHIIQRNDIERFTQRLVRGVFKIDQCVVDDDEQSPENRCTRQAVSEYVCEDPQPLVGLKIGIIFGVEVELFILGQGQVWGSWKVIYIGIDAPIQADDHANDDHETDGKHSNPACAEEFYKGILLAAQVWCNEVREDPVYGASNQQGNGQNDEFCALGLEHDPPLSLETIAPASYGDNARRIA